MGRTGCSESEKQAAVSPSSRSLESKDAQLPKHAHEHENRPPTLLCDFDCFLNETTPASQASSPLVRCFLPSASTPGTTGVSRHRRRPLANQTKATVRADGREDGPGWRR